MPTSTRFIYGTGHALIALAVLAFSPAPALASPIRYTITDLGDVPARGLANDGSLIDAPQRTFVGPLPEGFNPGGYGNQYTVVDGTPGGWRILGHAFGGGSSRSVLSFIYEPERNDEPRTFYMNRLPGMNEMYATDMNALGWTVGTANPDASFRVMGIKDYSRAFMHLGTTYDLNDFIPEDSGWLLRSAVSINDWGQILGRGINPDGQEHAYLLTPTTVPEPSVLAVLGLATAAAGLRHGYRRLRRHA